mmetsp:Transcript_49204/g.97327  ORF Transcript_49204/g.97327 Transcript_49204/m.97327 type:complete len:329 (+) Transcript_49204:1359-2345(+)
MRRRACARSSSLRLAACVMSRMLSALGEEFTVHALPWDDPASLKSKWSWSDCAENTAVASFSSSNPRAMSPSWDLASCCAVRALLTRRTCVATECSATFTLRSTSRRDVMEGGQPELVSESSATSTPRTARCASPSSASTSAATCTPAASTCASRWASFINSAGTCVAAFSISRRRLSLACTSAANKSSSSFTARSRCAREDGEYLALSVSPIALSVIAMECTSRSGGEVLSCCTARHTFSWRVCSCAYFALLRSCSRWCALVAATSRSTSSSAMSTLRAASSRSDLATAESRSHACTPSACTRHSFSAVSASFKMAPIPRTLSAVPP